MSVTKPAYTHTYIDTDFEKHTFQARREFDAPVSLVWRAYTEKELLDQWWAPKPFKAETVSMDFQPGGKWIYDMIGPDGSRHRATQIFNEIIFESCFSGIDAFVDELGNINESMPVATWKNTFLETERGTLVVIDAKYPNKEALEFVIRMGVDKGVSMAHDSLSELLASLV